MPRLIFGFYLFSFFSCGTVIVASKRYVVLSCLLMSSKQKLGKLNIVTGFKIRMITKLRTTANITLIVSQKKRGKVIFPTQNHFYSHDHNKVLLSVIVTS